MNWVVIAVPLAIIAVAAALAPVLYATLKKRKWQRSADTTTRRQSVRQELAKGAPSQIPGAPVQDRTPLVFMDDELQETDH